MRKYKPIIYFLILSFLMTSCTSLPKDKIQVNADKIFFNAKNIEKVYFDYNKSELRETDKVILSKVVQTLKGDPNTTILIVGHTDIRGTEEYNMALGERRANAVKKFLVNCDKSLDKKITVQSKGKNEPDVLVYSEDNKEAEKAHSKNRRAVIMLEDSSAN
ncbi:OmpA family protein [Neoehrlichia mikurensis]|uniref:OmpA family protein n=1 Tax=Neoehrlichia mikurensis TaxID=89586 RepID=A0A9Q9F3N2_9RICK|nr:OmpA family protein [Neoehrlichia mikurensis]QXK91834.1 OmpA family protein [Neoehrlichia mikurensis]QXK93047.1 OmpA family protein [Neoehrlichia mikurensis]QXK93525.1 OmpA family protein [Neoehrlichia mikurensis]UTO55519.1 OmpA family protein [Neoehrlichia mikurensis]UTO56440.1 OmpA family protein [Neoehrlichia mikurensis]